MSEIPQSTFSKDCLDGFSFYLIFSDLTVPYMVKDVNFPQYEYGDQKSCFCMAMFEYDLTFDSLHASFWPDLSSHSIVTGQLWSRTFTVLRSSISTYQVPSGLGE